MKKFGKLAVLIVLIALSIVLCSCNKTVDYTIYFDVDGTTYATISTTGDETIKIPDNPTKEGYTFAGWYWSDGTAFTVNSLLDAPISSDMTVYAKWITEAEYTIIFDSNGGSGISAVTAHGGESVIAPSAPTKTGFTFVGWYTDNSFSNIYTFSVMPENNITLYAKWNANTTSDITITFSVDGVTYSTIKTTGNETIQIPYNPIKEGYTFSGWYWADGNAFTVNSLLTTPISSSMTVYAKWITVAEYSLTFVSNGGSDIDTIGYHGGETVAQPSAPTRDGYIFDGWFIDNGSFNNAFSFSAMPAYNVILYAKWTANNADPYISITGGTVSGTSIYIETEYTTTQLDLSAIISVASSSNWLLYKDITGQTLIPTKYASNLKNGNNIYYVVVNTDNGNVNRTYTLTIYRNFYVTMTYVSVSATYTTEQVLTHTTMGDGPEITRTGYTFDSWGCSGYYVTEAKTFTASWTANIYDVTLDVNGGEQLSVNEFNLNYDSSFTLPVPQKKGYNFVGWYTAASSGTQYTSGTGASTKVWSIAGNAKLYAQWSINSYTVTLNTLGNGGSVSGGGNKVFNSTVTITASTYSGYTWLGWYDGEDKVSSGTDLIYEFTMPSENKTYTARWIKVTLDKNIFAAGSVSGLNTAYKVGDSATITATTNTGYTWLGWYDDNTKVSTGASLTYTFVMSSNNKTYEAKWEANSYLVNLDVNGGNTLSINNVEVIYESSFTLPIPTISNIYLSFKGWVLEQDGIQTKYTDEEGNSLNNWNIANNITLIALWGANYNDNYIINKDDFKHISVDSNYILLADIDMENAAITPIGTSDEPYSGIFDGNGHKINNFRFNSDYNFVNNRYLGIFGYNTGTIKNLEVNINTTSIHFRSNQVYAGIIVGVNSGNIYNCFSTGTISVADSGYIACVYVGGVVGRSGGGTISNCYSTANITARSSGTGYPNAYAGGIVGGIVASTLNFCYATGNINATIGAPVNSYYSTCACAGGLIGSVWSNGNSSVSNSFATGNVVVSIDSTDSISRVGGFSSTNYVLDSNNIYRYDGQTISGERIADLGVSTSYTNLQSENYLINTIGFGKYISEEDILINPNNVWIFAEGAFPKLYWQTD